MKISEHAKQRFVERMRDKDPQEAKRFAAMNSEMITEHFTNYSIPIVITTVRKQNRKHKKHRINKKWAKKYGFDEFELMPDNEASLIDGKLYMQRKVYEKLRKELQT